MSTNSSGRVRTRPRHWAERRRSTVLPHSLGRRWHDGRASTTAGALAGQAPDQPRAGGGDPGRCGRPARRGWRRWWRGGRLGGASAAGRGLGLRRGRVRRDRRAAGRRTGMGAPGLVGAQHAAAGDRDRAGGRWLVGQRAASVRRLGAVLWFLAVAAVAGFAEVVADQVLHQSHGLQHVIAGLAATAAGVLFWRLRVSSLQQVAVLVSLLATVTAVVEVVAPASPSWGGGAVWAVGVAWLLLGSRRLLIPARTAEVLGALAMLLGAETVRGGELRSWGLALGLLSAAALVGAGAAARRTVLLSVGAVGLFVFPFDATLTWFGRGATVPLALLVTGGALLLVAVLTGRIRRSPATQDRRRGVPG